MKKIEDYYVPWIKDIPMFGVKLVDLAWTDASLGRMMTNEGPFPPSKAVLDAIEKYSKMGNSYLDQGVALRKRLAELNGLEDEGNVLLGNGSSEVVDMIWRSFIVPQVDEVIQQPPCFAIYKLRAAITGAKLVSVPMKLENKKLEFDPDGILKAITPKTKIIAVTNPNNPSGNFMPEKDFRRIAETGIPFLIDEAYIEFAMDKTLVKLVKEYPNVMVSRTMSKAYGLAGLRLGYLLAGKHLIKQISSTVIPWNISTITAWACLAAVNDQATLKERVDHNNQQVKWITEELGKIPGLIILESYGNYILMESSDAGFVAKDACDYVLKTRKCIIKPEDNIAGRTNWFRISISTTENNKKVVEGIKEFIAKNKK